MGGSLGAQVLNENVPRALALLDAASRPKVIHQAGTRHIDALRASYRAANVEAELVPFITDIAKHYAEADLVICRAGALTVSELAAAGVASVLVPYPHAVDDHQTSNARYLSDNKAAFLIPQAELTPQRLADLLRQLTRRELLRMAEAARTFGKPDATSRVAHICMEAAQ